MLNFYLSLTNRNMATRRNVPNKGIDGGRILVPYANGSRFFAPLTDSVVPNRSMWPITFSRSSGATVLDHEWIVRYAKSGEARFQGARRVENMTAHSKTFTNPTWTKANLLTVTGNAIAWPAGLGMATSLIETATTTQHGIITSNSYANVAGNVYISSFYAKAGARSFVQLLTNWTISLEYANFDLVNGIFSQSSAGVGAMVSVGDGWYRCSIKYTSLSSTTAVVYCMIGVSLADVRYQSYVGDGVSNVYIDACQHEDVTGQSIKTPSEYVSTNLLSSPFHGAMVDWVKYFDTTLSGTQLSPDGYLAEWQKTNLFTDSEDFSLWTKSGTWVITPNATIAPDGRMTADLFTLSTSNESQWVTKVITTTAVIYWDSVYVKPNGHYYVQFNTSFAISTWFVNFDLLNWVVGSSSLWAWRIEALKDGWFRLKVTTWTAYATSNNVSFAFCQSATSTRGSVVQGTWSSWVYLWWAQLEVWASSSYIPTAGATVTRNDDILEYQLRNLESKQWAVYAETTNYFTTTNVALLWLTGGSCRVLWSSGTSPWFYLGSGTQVTANDGTSNLTSSNSVAASQYNRVIWKYSGVTHELCVNGILTSGTFDGTTSYTNLCIGNSTANTRWLYGSIRNLQIWDYEISDAEAVALTTI